MKKTAIVTGAVRGIGFAVARRLGLNGYNVVVVATGTEEKNSASLEKLKGDGTACHYVQANVAEAAGREKIIEEAVRVFGGIHVLVNNAGVAPLERRDLLEMTEESFDRVIGINTKGTMFLTQLAARQMLKQPVEGKKRGTIINISSCSAEVVSVNRGEYCVSKAGLAMITGLFAARLAPESIFVHEIRPGIIATDMTSGVKQKYDDLIEKGIFPISRWGVPEDVAEAVSVFAGDSFTYTTGNVVDVDGGFHIRTL